VELIPAVDLLGGAAVRLRQGDYDQATDFGDPATLVRTFCAGGVSRLHLVDLDAARTGAPVNRPVIMSLVAEATVAVQVGGGVRTLGDVEALVHAGVDRVILGTVVLEDLDRARQMIRAAPGRVAIGLDYRRRDDGALEPYGRGWLNPGGTTTTEVFDALADLEVAAVIATAIAADGMGSGPDLAGLVALLQTSPFPVVASGGVGSLEDLAALARLSHLGRRLSGAVVGRALADGAFTVAEGVATCARSG